MPLYSLICFKVIYIYEISTMGQLLFGMVRLQQLKKHTQPPYPMGTLMGFPSVGRASGGLELAQTSSQEQIVKS